MSMFIRQKPKFVFAVREAVKDVIAEAIRGSLKNAGILQRVPSSKFQVSS